MSAQGHSFTLTCHHEGIRDSQKRKILVERQVLRRTKFGITHKSASITWVCKKITGWYVSVEYLELTLDTMSATPPCSSLVSVV